MATQAASMHFAAGKKGDLFVPVSRHLASIVDREISSADYRVLISSRIAGFKDAIAHRPASPAFVS